MKTEDVLKAATPRPWRESGPLDGIRGADGNFICGDFACIEAAPGEGQANRSLVILAVNSYERQRECIAEMVEALRQAGYREDCAERRNGSNNQSIAAKLFDMRSALARARELLGDEKRVQADQPSHTEGHIDCPACDLNRWELLRKERAER